MLVLFLIMLFVATLFSFFLIYHWRSYGESSVVVTPTLAVYLIGTLCFFAGMGTAVLTTL